MVLKTRYSPGVKQALLFKRPSHYGSELFSTINREKVEVGPACARSVVSLARSNPQSARFSRWVKIDKGDPSDDDYDARDVKISFERSGHDAVRWVLPVALDR
jgi:hypothetical protein